MKMMCNYKSMLRGDIVKQGQVLDLTEDECKMDVVKRYFVAVENTASEGQSSGVVVAGLTRDEAILKLQQAGQNVSPRISDKRLAERFEEVFSATA